MAFWITRDYPRHPPITYVVPTINMLVRAGKHLDVSGRCNAEYIQNWERKDEGCSLSALLESLQEHFSKEPPVYLKPKQDHPSVNVDKSSPQQTNSQSTFASGSDAVRPPLPSKPPSIVTHSPSADPNRLTNPVCFLFSNSFPVHLDSLFAPLFVRRHLRLWGSRHRLFLDDLGWREAGLHHLQIILPWSLFSSRDHISTELTHRLVNHLHRPYRCQHLHFRRQIRDFQNLMLFLMIDRHALLKWNRRVFRFPICWTRMMQP